MNKNWIVVLMAVCTLCASAQSDAKKLKSMVEYYASGVNEALVKLRGHQYDSSGREIELVEYSLVNPLKYRTTRYTYDKQGNKTTEKRFKNDSLISMMKFRNDYDEQNRLVLVEASSPNYNRFTKYTYKVDEFGYEQTSDVGNNLPWYKKTKFDNKDNVLREEYYSPDGEGELTYNRYDEFGNMVRSVHEYRNIDSTLFQYSINNVLVRETKYTKFSVRETSYEFDANGYKSRATVQEFDRGASTPKTRVWKFVVTYFD